MKGRPKSIRKISFVPPVTGFIPYGRNFHYSDEECVWLTFEEYEALRLNDYEKKIQCEAAAEMGVSRPTYTRIYMSAREKIAQALVEGKELKIGGGHVELKQAWYRCHHCHAVFTLDTAVQPCRCGLCGSTDVQPYELPDTEPSFTLERRNCCRSRQGGHPEEEITIKQ